MSEPIKWSDEKILAVLDEGGEGFVKFFREASEKGQSDRESLVAFIKDAQRKEVTREMALLATGTLALRALRGEKETRKWQTLISRFRSPR